MCEIIEYKGFKAPIKFDEHTGIYHARAIGVCNWMICAVAYDYPEIIEIFHDVVDNYLRCYETWLTIRR